MPTALITGIEGQDGHYLCELLISKGYKIFGVRNPSRQQKREPRADVEYVDIDLRVEEVVQSTISSLRPTEIYHLASDVEPRVLRNGELEVFDTNFRSGVNILNAVVAVSLQTKIYFAGSSLMFGANGLEVQNEYSPMIPDTPYGIAKVTMYRFIQMYRKIYGVHAVCGILFNHESPRRSSRFLPKKITSCAAKIKLGKQRFLYLGNLEASRDWCHAKDVVESMWMMLQTGEKRDFVIGGGQLNTVRDILDIAFGHLGLDWKSCVKHDSSLLRVVEMPGVRADTTAAKNVLGWSRSIGFEQMITEMVDWDLELEVNAN
jgi:GDPmannose 4,6-dehydratase